MDSRGGGVYCCPPGRRTLLLARTDAWLRDEHILLDSWQASHLLCSGMEEDKRNTGTCPPGTFLSKRNPNCCYFHLSLSHVLAFVYLFMISLLFVSCSLKINSKSSTNHWIEKQMFKNTSWQWSSTPFKSQIPGNNSIIITIERRKAEPLTLRGLTYGAWTDVQSRTLAGCMV